MLLSSSSSATRASSSWILFCSRFSLFSVCAFRCEATGDTQDELASAAAQRSSCLASLPRAPWCGRRAAYLLLGSGGAVQPLLGLAVLVLQPVLLLLQAVLLLQPLDLPLLQEPGGVGVGEWLTLGTYCHS